MSLPNQPWSRSHAAFHGWRSRSAGSAPAISTKRRRMKSSWMGIGFSHHSVPSLSNTATRSSGATRSAADATKSRIARLAGPSRQLASAVAGRVDVVATAARYVRPGDASSPEADDRSPGQHAAQADVAHARVDHLRPARGGPVAQAVLVGAQERAALDDLARDPELRPGRVEALALRSAARVPRDAAGALRGIAVPG